MHPFVHFSISPLSLTPTLTHFTLFHQLPPSLFLSFLPLSPNPFSLLLPSFSWQGVRHLSRLFLLCALSPLLSPSFLGAHSLSPPPSLEAECDLMFDRQVALEKRLIYQRLVILLEWTEHPPQASIWHILSINLALP